MGTGLRDREKEKRHRKREDKLEKFGHQQHIILCSHKYIKVKTHKMFLPKKYMFTHVMTIVRSHKIGTSLHNRPTLGLPLFFPSVQVHPCCITGIQLPPFLPPNPRPLPCPFSGRSALRCNWPSQRGEKMISLGTTRCASLKEMIFSPSFPLVGRGCQQRMESGRAPHKGKSVGTEVSGTHHTLASRKPLLKL